MLSVTLYIVLSNCVLNILTFTTYPTIDLFNWFYIFRLKTSLFCFCNNYIWIILRVICLLYTLCTLTMISEGKGRVILPVWARRINFHDIYIPLIYNLVWIVVYTNIILPLKAKILNLAR